MLRLVIFVEGGVVQEVLCSERCEYLVIDQDVQDEELERELTDTRGNKFTAAIDRFEEVAHPDAVEHYFQQA
jgi:hypothetical protein